MGRSRQPSAIRTSAEAPSLHEASPRRGVRHPAEGPSWVRVRATTALASLCIVSCCCVVLAVIPSAAAAEEEEDRRATPSPLLLDDLVEDLSHVTPMMGEESTMVPTDHHHHHRHLHGRREENEAPPAAASGPPSNERPSTSSTPNEPAAPLAASSSSSSSSFIHSGALRRLFYSLDSRIVPMRVRFQWFLPATYATLTAAAAATANGLPFATGANVLSSGQLGLLLDGGGRDLIATVPPVVSYELSTELYGLLDHVACSVVGQRVLVHHEPLTATNVGGRGFTPAEWESNGAENCAPPTLVNDCIYTCKAADLLTSAKVAALLQETLAVMGVLEQYLSTTTAASGEAEAAGSPSTTSGDQVNYEKGLGCGPFNLTTAVMNAVATESTTTLVIVATVRKSWHPHRTYVAPGTCHVHPVTGRPLVAYVSVDPEVLDAESALRSYAAPTKSTPSSSSIGSTTPLAQLSAVMETATLAQSSLGSSLLIAAAAKLTSGNIATAGTNATIGSKSAASGVSTATIAAQAATVLHQQHQWQLRRVIMQAVLHSMAFKVSLLGNFTFPGSVDETYYRHDAAAYPTGPVKGDPVKFDIGRGTISLTSSGAVGDVLDITATPPVDMVKLVTPKTVAAARSRFHCSTLSGVELEQSGFVGGLIFLEKRLFFGEAMTLQRFDTPPLYVDVSAAISDDAAAMLARAHALVGFSVISASVLEDSGWYTVSDKAGLEAATSKVWLFGVNEGCDFVQLPCGKGGWSDAYQCTDLRTQNVSACGYDYSFTGRCNVMSYADGIPDEFKFFEDSNTLAGADISTDYCPYVDADRFNGRGLGSCFQPLLWPLRDATILTALTSASPTVTGGVVSAADGWASPGSTYGPHSLCFQAAQSWGPSYSSASSSSSTKTASRSLASCYPTGCWTVVDLAAGTSVKKLHVLVGRHLVECNVNVTYEFVLPRSSISEDVIRDSEADAAFLATQTTLAPPLPQNATQTVTATTAAPPTSPLMTPVQPNQRVAILDVMVKGDFQCGGHTDFKCGHPATTIIDFVPQITSISPRNVSANGGATVTVVGTNLVACTGVVIGGLVAPALYHFASGTLRARTKYLIETIYGTAAKTGLGWADVGVWCAVGSICPDGCVTSRITKAINITDYAPCAATDDADRCTDQPPCEWDGSRCVNRIVETTTPPPTPPPPPPPNPYDDGCSIAFPRRCNTTGACVLSLEHCLRCPVDLFQCDGGNCVESLADCGCSADAPVVCPPAVSVSTVARCVASSSECALPPPVCDQAAGETLCWNNRCVRSVQSCPCPPGSPVRCEGSSACVVHASQCRPLDDDCPLDAPIPCWDDRCAFTSAKCRCARLTPYACFDKTCVADRESCGCPSSFPLKCPAPVGCLSNDIASCPLLNVTTSSCDPTQFRCLDGKCVATDSDCPCSSLATTVPTVRILSPDSWRNVDVRTSFTANPTFLPCGVDRTSQVSYRWSIELVNKLSVSVDPNLTAVEAFPSPAATALGRQPLRTTITTIPRSHYFDQVLVLPPRTLEPDAVYVFTVVVLASANGLSSYNFIRIRTFEANSTISVDGGRRTVPGSGFTMLAAFVTERGSPVLESDDVLEWDCCVTPTAGLQIASSPSGALATDSGGSNTNNASAETPSSSASSSSRCRQRCPALLDTITSVRTFAVSIRAADGIPVGPTTSPPRIRARGR